MARRTKADLEADLEAELESKQRCYDALLTVARWTKADLEAELESKQRCYDALLIYARGVEVGDVTRLRRGRYTAHLVGLHRADGGAIRVEEEGCVWSAPRYVSEWLARMRALLGGLLSEDEVDLMVAVEEAALRGESTGEEEVARD